MADSVMPVLRPAVDGPLLQRKCACGGSCDDCSKKRTLQRSTAPGAVTADVAPGIVHDAMRSGGRPLDAATRAFMEPRFGRDFSSVRVHTGDLAARSAAAVDSHAFTVGNHIVFGQGRFAPASREGKSLLAHELAHTVQQHGAKEDGESLQIGAEHGAAEREADAVASSAVLGKPSAVHACGPQLSRATRTFLLTFDDGPHAASLGKGVNRTEKVLDTLCAKGVKAGFFVQTAAQDAQGSAIRGSAPAGKTLIKRMASDGHLVGIHTGGKTDHESHIKAEKAGRLSSELGSAKKFLGGLTGSTPTLVRPPFGSFNPAVSKVYSTLGLSNVLWDIDGDQGKSQPLADLKQRVTDGINTMIAGKWKGSTPLAPNIVVLYHDIQKSTADNVGPLIEHIKKETSALTAGKDTAAFPSISCKGMVPPAPAPQEPALKPEPKDAGPVPEPNVSEAEQGDDGEDVS